MDLKVKITEQLRQLQLTMQRSAFRNVQAHSSYRGQGRVLSILMEQPEISRKELGETVDISRQALTELLQKMEKRGYIVRRPDPRDRRVLLIRLTQEGRRAAEENRRGVQDLSRLLECLDDDKLALFSECLETILLHERELYPNSCSSCTGPENCSHDYLKYGHTLPNPRFCKYAHLFSEAQAGGDENCVGGGQS
ncbi:MAG: MarR family transcriptional regulator [Oscillospiraceae bacterium]|nr:MarR family transcriptional regulator [Oscillospiraceae bacterium]